MMQTYEFDDKVLKPGRFRFHVLRTFSVTKRRQKLVEKQNGKCACCGRTLGNRVQVDHIKSVKEFAYDLTLALTDAYRQCHDDNNLRAVHPECNNARNRKNKGEL